MLSPKVHIYLRIDIYLWKGHEKGEKYVDLQSVVTGANVKIRLLLSLQACAVPS